MLRAIKKFFDNYLSSEAEPAKRDQEHAARLASAALLIEISRADDEIREQELNAIVRALRSKFGLSPEETEALIKLAEEEATQATSYYEFTSLINREFSYERKVYLVELLWSVAVADQELEKYEEHAVRKLAELLYVSHTDFIAAKHRAQRRSGA
jgi:uncharacterized tellurite resistance protein B-like protein